MPSESMPSESMPSESMPSTRSAGMPISLNMSQADNIQPSLQAIKKIALDFRLNVLNAHNIVLHKFPLLVALPPISTPSIGRTRILIAYSMITLRIIVSKKYLRIIQISF